MGGPQIIHFNKVFHYKPSILGYHYFWKHPNVVAVHSTPFPDTSHQWDDSMILFELSWKVKRNGHYPKVKTSFFLVIRKGWMKKTGIEWIRYSEWVNQLDQEGAFSSFLEVVKNTAAKLFNDRCPLVHRDQFRKSNISSRPVQK